MNNETLFLSRCGYFTILNWLLQAISTFLIRRGSSKAPLNAACRHLLFFSQAQRCSSFKFRYISKNCKYSFVCVCKIVPTLSTTKTCYVFHLKNYKKFTSKLSVWVFACHSPFLFGFCFSFTNKLNLKTRNFLLFFLSHRLMWIFLAPFESIHGEVPSVLFHIFKLLLLLAVDTLFSLPLLLHTRKKAAL